jgi:DNA invertase Pin-like site-specific DNA recombinase
MRGFVERRGWSIYGEYVDTGWSGTKKDRPQLHKVMKDASQHRFDAILVYKVDRFGRSVLNLMESIEQLRSWDVRLIATSQSLDTDQDTATGRLMLQILAAVAEFERSMIVERVKAGLVAARKRGVRLGRAPLVVDREKVWALHMRGKSIRQIAAETGANRGTVHRLIKAKFAAA